METVERIVWQTAFDYTVENEAMAIQLAMNMVISFLQGQTITQANDQCNQLLENTGWSMDRKVQVQKRSLEILEGLKEEG